MKKKTSLNVGDRVYYKPTSKRQMITTVTDLGGHRDLNELVRLRDEEGVVFYSAEVPLDDELNNITFESHPIIDEKAPKGFKLTRVLNSMYDLIYELSDIHDLNPKEKVHVATYYSDGTVVAGYARAADGCVLGEDDFIIADYADVYALYRKVPAKKV